MRRNIGLFCLGALLLTGCASMGPPTISRDRFDYVASISGSWKRQMLLNVLMPASPESLERDEVVTSGETEYCIMARAPFTCFWRLVPITV